MEILGPRVGQMHEKETPKDTVFETERETRDGIPGEEESALISIETRFNKDGHMSQVRVDRGHGIVPSTLTVYAWIRKNNDRFLSAARSYIFASDGKAYFAEEVTKGKSEPFPTAPSVRELVDVFKAPGPGNSQNLREAIEKARKLRHPAIKISKDAKYAYVTKVKTDLEEGPTLMEFSVFSLSPGLKPRAESITRFFLRVVDWRWTEPLPVTQKFVYNNGKCIGMEQYVGKELQFREEYVNPHEIVVGGKNFVVYDKDRQYGEETAREAQRSGEYRELVVDPQSGKPKWSFTPKP